MNSIQPKVHILLETLFLTVLTSKGMESVLQEEIEEILEDQGLPLLGPCAVGPGCVTLSGDWKTVVALNLCLRTGTRVLVGLSRAKVRDLDALYKMAGQIPWEELFSVDQTFAVVSTVGLSRINHNLMVNLKIKDAIADRFREKMGRRPSVDKESPDIGIYAKIHQDFLDISLDTSGKSLSHRGGRPMSHAAPLREPVAAGLLRLSGWNRMIHSIFSRENSGEDLCYFDRSVPGEEPIAGDTSKRYLPLKVPLLPFFYDPMCGTGTLPIEAALVLKKRFPALSRSSFPFLNIRPAQKMGVAPFYEDFKVSLSQQERKGKVIREKMAAYWERAQKAGVVEEVGGSSVASKDSLFFIRASDHHSEAVRFARINAEAAGVASLVDFSVKDVADSRSGMYRGTVVVNPPYGERIGGDEAELDELYHKLGNVWKKNFPGCLVWVLSGNEQALKKIGLRATRRYQIFNGGLMCRFHQYVIV